MSRWIDAEWLMNFFVDIPNNFTLTIGNLRATVNDAPSIDLVRCKKCKHRTYCYSEVHMTNKRQTVDIHKTVDFCSFGEREDE